MKLLAFAALLFGAVALSGCTGKGDDSGDDSAVNSAE